jgi:prepilin-type N-terminal cleavage/methylation domain-containing protein
MSYFTFKLIYFFLMKIPRRTSCRLSGFTLVELLVVIAIIAILASVIAVAAGSAINQAKRAKANNTANQINTAAVNYYTEYGAYPVPTGTASDVSYNDTDNGDWGPLALALSGNINAYAPGVPAAGLISNPRNIAFLTPKKSEVDQNGIPFNPFTSATTPRYFNISMDSDYSGVLGDTGNDNMPDFTVWKQGSTSQANVKLTQGVAVWACCDPTKVTTPTASTSPNFWVHTY